VIVAIWRSALLHFLPAGGRTNLGRATRSSRLAFALAAAVATAIVGIIPALQISRGALKRNRATRGWRKRHVAATFPRRARPATESRFLSRSSWRGPLSTVAQSKNDRARFR
jgi:hypothetical protein